MKPYESPVVCPVCGHKCTVNPFHDRHRIGYNFTDRCEHQVVNGQSASTDAGPEKVLLDRRSWNEPGGDWVNGWPRVRPRMSNFWIDAEIDGRETKLEGGPAAKDGGFRLDLTMLDKGQIVKGLVIEGEVLGDNLTLRVWGHKGRHLIYAHCTTR